MTLKEILEEKKCFKLICGAGNENLDEVEKLVAIYAKAGCHFFDLSASEEVLMAAKRGLDFSVAKEEQKKYHFCISVGIKGEPHLNKAKINTQNCKNCKKCIKICLQNAIRLEGRLGLPDQQLKIDEKKCIGCSKCLRVCEYDAIEIYQKNKPIEEIFSPIKPHLLMLSCVELHAASEDEADVQSRWEYLNNNFDEMLSICIDRSKLSNEAVLNRIKFLIKERKPYTTILQADGSPMSGGEDDFRTTLQAVAMAEIIQNENLPVYILLSGGTNSKTTELARLCGIEANGVAIGSYARKIVKKYIEREDFWTNKAIFEDASKIARKLIKNSIQT